MHLQEVTFAYVTPAPSDWGGICWLAHEAKGRALGQGIVKAVVERLDWSEMFQTQPEGQTGFRKWHYESGHHHKATNPIPKGHIAVLVTGWTSKE